MTQRTLLQAERDRLRGSTLEVLRERLSKLLDDIGYWDHIVVKPVN